MLPVVLSLALLHTSDGDVRSWLERLRADSAAERSLAQRWLGSHLTEGDLDLVRRTAIEGDAETRRRLALALSDDDAHIEIAANLAASNEEPAVRVGRTALADGIARWAPGWTAAALVREDVLVKLRDDPDRLGGPDRIVAIDPRAKEKRLDLALDELSRLAPNAPLLVLDPDLALADHPRELAAEIEGPFDRILDKLVGIHRADLEGFDFPKSEGAPGRSWIRIGRARTTNRLSAAGHVAAWCEELVRAGDPARRSACSRAIAATGWPDGLAWLERRWRARSDEAALDGILLAAGRGLVSPSLADPDVQRSLYRSMDLLAGGKLADTSRADAIARAIGVAGPRGPRGEDLAAIAVEGLAERSPREQWLRLVALEGMHPVSATAASAIDALLAAPGTLPPVVLQALRARAAIRAAGSKAPAVREATALLLWADAARRVEECTSLLVSLGVEPPRRGEVPKNSSARSSSLRLAELEWLFFAGELPEASRSLLALSAPAEQGGLGLEMLSSRTRTWVLRGSRARLEAAIAGARALGGADAVRLDRLEILSGAGSADLRARVLERTSSPSSREDLLCLAALATGPSAEVARDALLRSLTGNAPSIEGDDVIAALDVALAFVRAARDDFGERALIQAVRKTAREGPSELRARFGVESWPTPEREAVVRGWEGDRSLERSSLP